MPVKSFCGKCVTWVQRAVNCSSCSTSCQQIFHTYNKKKTLWYAGAKQTTKIRIYLAHASLKYYSRQDKLCVACVLINVCLYAHGLNFQQTVHLKEWGAYEIYTEEKVRMEFEMRWKHLTSVIFWVLQIFLPEVSLMQICKSHSILSADHIITERKRRCHGKTN